MISVWSNLSVLFKNYFRHTKCWFTIKRKICLCFSLRSVITQVVDDVLANKEIFDDLKNIIYLICFFFLFKWNSTTNSSRFHYIFLMHFVCFITQYVIHAISAPILKNYWETKNSYTINIKYSNASDVFQSWS